MAAPVPRLNYCFYCHWFNFIVFRQLIGAGFKRWTQKNRKGGVRSLDCPFFINWINVWNLGISASVFLCTISLQLEEVLEANIQNSIEKVSCRPQREFNEYWANSSIFVTFQNYFKYARLSHTCHNLFFWLLFNIQKIYCKMPAWIQ